MTSLARHHARWCLIATATLLVVAFALHDVSAQFRPPNWPPGTGVSGNSGGGFSGVQGAGVSGNSGAGFSGRPNNFSGASGVSGFSGGIGGGRVEYFCSRCNQKVSQSASRCPNCGAIFTGTTLMPGSGPSSGAGGVLGNAGGNNLGQPGGGSPPQGNAGNNQPASQPPADNPPANNPASDAPSSGSSGSSAKSGSKDDKDSGLSTALIVGVSIAALGLFAVIAGLVIVMNSGGRRAKKSRPRRLREDDDYD